MESKNSEIVKKRLNLLAKTGLVLIVIALFFGFIYLSILTEANDIKV
jgi:hypothetical protein